MSDFDPYRKWLGIPCQHQPPNYYRLLSIDLYESDEDVIRAAVDRIVSFLQDVATGPRANDSQMLLNEIAAARVCLLDPARKAVYDRQLKSELAQSMGSPTDGIDPVSTPVTPAIDLGTSCIETPLAARSRRVLQRTTRAKGKRSAKNQRVAALWRLFLLLAGGLLLGAMVLAWLAVSRGDAERRAVEESRIRERQESFAKMAREAESMIPQLTSRSDGTKLDRTSRVNSVP